MYTVVTGKRDGEEYNTAWMSAEGDKIKLPGKQTEATSTAQSVTTNTDFYMVK